MKMKIKHILYSAVLSLCLAACGGGNASSEPPNTISLYGDSYTNSDPLTSSIVAKQLPTIVIRNFAVGGATADQVVAGVWRPDQVLANPAFETFDKQMSVIESKDIVVFRYGIADIVGNVDSSFKKNLSTLIEKAKYSGRSVIIVNIVKIPETTVFPKGATDKVLVLNDIMKELSGTYNVPLIDLYNNTTITLDDILSDQLHLNPSTTIRVADQIGVELKRILNIGR